MLGQHGANGPQSDKERALQRHVCPVPSSSPRGESTTSRKSYTKDGRKIDIGDCALFQAGNAPPFIGILRKVTVDKDNSVKLRVNWLYRPADVKLAKGVPIDAAPNEIFYSFHKDDTPAASLLHPCKVAFLRKGVELPSGVSSFVCRRVYDIANKRLWWLTDRDYTDEHQEEVDQLLNRTKLEMQAALQQQPGARSPKSSLALPEHTKGKKRERPDSGTHEPSSKRLKPDDSESSFVKVDRSITRPEEIASITDKDGGLSSVAGVEKLLALMQQDRNDGTRKPIEVVSRRIMLAGVVASTDKQECRDRLVQLGGLAVLDDWLQEAHKGKSGDGGNPAEIDKVLDDLLLTLLRALQKLPVDLDALKTCAVGKSVNNLKNHRNSEIQRKARKLVETWKKRVDAEMKSGEKPGTPGKQPPSSGDPLQTLTSAKDAKSSTKLNVPAVGDAQAKSVGSATSKSGTTGSSKENSPNNSGSNEIQGVSVKEEKSCASQAQNYGPTWSSAPVTSACKEESKPVSKSTRLSSKADAGQKENGSSKWGSRTSANTAAERPVGAEKSSGEIEAPTNQRLILRFPNPGKSPARANGESQGKVSSPKVLDRQSSSGLGEGTKSKHHPEISSKKRHRSSGDKSAGVANGKVSDKTNLRDNQSGTNGVDGGMSLLATVAADEIMKCDGSCVTASTVTEEGNVEQDNLGMTSEQVPSSEQGAVLPKEDGIKGKSTDLVKVEPPEEGKPDPQLDRKPSDAQKQVGNGLKREGSRSPASPEEDALEVARKVAKEVEQEVEGFGKTRHADAVKEVQPSEEPPSSVPESEPASAEGKATPDENQRSTEQPSTCEADDRASEGASRPLFDLNEGLPSEEAPTFVPPAHPVLVTVSPLSAPIPVMATSAGAFIPIAPVNALKTEVGWKGAAATSAFRPAEPRAAVEKKAKPALDIDLNIADADDASATLTNLEADSSTVGAVRSFLSSFPSTSAVEKTGLDLNQVNEGEEGGGSLRLRLPGPSSSNVNILRNFDLNDGPEEPQTEDAFLRGFKPKTNPVPSPSPNQMGNMNGELLNLSSWFSGGSSFGVAGLRSDAYPAQQHQHAYVNGAAGGAFASDIYRAAGGSSSMLGYQANAPQALYSYPNFPFPFTSSSTFVAPTPYVGGSTVPATYSTIPSQVVNSAVSAFARPPYFMGVTENGGTLEVGNSWGRRGLDLNAGADSSTAMGTASVGILGDSEGRQPYVIPVNDPMRAFHQAASLKRKEPETGWDVYRSWR